MISFQNTDWIQLFDPNPNDIKNIEFPPTINYTSHLDSKSNLISSFQHNEMIGSEDVKDYLEGLSRLFDKDLSFRYYTDTGYYVCKHLSKLNDYSFTYWELFFVRLCIEQIECIFKSFSMKEEDYNLTEIHFKYVSKNMGYLELIGSSEMEDIKSLSKVYYIGLVKIKDFLEGKKRMYEPHGECIWGDNKIALKKLYDLSKNKYFEDRGFELFYSAFLLNHYIGSERNKINFLENPRFVMSYFLNETKKYYLPYYRENYTEWVINTVEFKGKSKDYKRVNELLNLYMKEGISSEKIKNEIKIIKGIVEKVDRYYLDESYPKSKNNTFNTSL